MNRNLSKFWKVLQRQRFDDVFCDLQLVAKNYERLSVHACILAAASDALHCKLKSIWIENSGNSSPHVLYLTDYTYAVISQMLDVIYHCASLDSSSLVLNGNGCPKELLKLANEWNCISLLEESLNCKLSFSKDDSVVNKNLITDLNDKEPVLRNEVHGVFSDSTVRQLLAKNACSHQLVKKEAASADVCNTNGDVQGHSQIGHHSCTFLVADSILEGIESSDNVSEEVKKEWKSCEYCMKFRGKKKGNLSYHKKFCMKAIQHCPGCKQPFLSSLEQINHSCKKNPKRHICELCGKQLSSKDGLLLHRQVHEGTKNKVCNICGKKFQRCCQLKCHMMRVHCRDRPFACGQCPMTFAFQFDLKKHIKTMHEGKPTVSKVQVKDPALELSMFKGRRLLPKPVCKPSDGSKDPKSIPSINAPKPRIQNNHSLTPHYHFLDLNKLVQSASFHSKPGPAETNDSPCTLPSLTFEEVSAPSTAPQSLITTQPALQLTSPTIPFSMSIQQDMLQSSKTQPEEPECQVADESLTASNILVNHYLDAHALTTNLPHDLDDGAEDISDSVSNSLSFSSANFSLSHTFGTFDNGMNISNSGNCLDDHVAIASESGSIYQAIIGESGQITNDEERLEGLAGL